MQVNFGHICLDDDDLLLYDPMTLVVCSALCRVSQDGHCLLSAHMRTILSQRCCCRIFESSLCRCGSACSALLWHATIHASCAYA